MILLDVNVLIALADHDHVHHPTVRAMHRKFSRSGWATCPLTENGFLRILGHSKYPKGPGSTDAARLLLVGILSQPGHEFWPDSISLSDLSSHPTLPPSRDLTDYYLLALAVRRKARLASLDRRIDSTLLPGGSQAYYVIPAES